MHKSIVEKQLKKYMTYSVKNDEFILDADKMNELATELVKLFAIPVVMQQSEQFKIFMVAVVNLLKVHKDEHEMKITHISESITPKGDFLCLGDPNDIPGLQNLLNEYELFVADLERAIKILNCA
jgi:hypothetical protein